MCCLDGERRDSEYCRREERIVWAGAIPHGYGVLLMTIPSQMCTRVLLAVQVAKCEDGVE